MGINCDAKVQSSSSLEVKQNPTGQKSGKLNHHVVKPIGAAHNGLGKLFTILIGIVALPAIALVAAATVGAAAVAIAVALSPAVLVAGGIYVACTGGSPLAAAGLICGGVALSIIGGGGFVACRFGRLRIV